MKTNLSNEVMSGKTGAQFAYLLDCIKNGSRATDEGREFANDREAVKFFFEVFNDEFNDQNNKRLFPNLQDRIANYLLGLPSVCSVDYWHDEIIKLGLIWGVLNETEGRKAEKFLENYWSVLGCRLIQMAQKLDVNPYQYLV